MAKKYLRPLTDILDEVVAGMVFTMQADSVVLNANGTQTLFCCDIFHAQVGFDITINSLSYKIVAFSQIDETITVKANFTGVSTITAGTIFDLYRPYFYHGTPITTQTELAKIKNANLKTPIIWLWENFTEKIDSFDIVERTIPNIELYALTQPPKILKQMERKDILTGCVQPMRRLMLNLMDAIIDRSDIFSADDLEYELENFPLFGIIARNKGAVTSVFMDNLSGVAGYTTLELFFKDYCPCPEIVIPVISLGIGSAPIGTTLIL